MPNPRPITETLISSQTSFLDIAGQKGPSITTQWQANFCQVFPSNFSDLPQCIHKADEEFFNAYWRGAKEWNDIPLTFENFMFLHYPGSAPIKIVAKKSGKPFKSGSETAQVKCIIGRSIPTAHWRESGESVVRAVYEFVDEPDGYTVEVRQCVDSAVPFRWCGRCLAFKACFVRDVANMIRPSCGMGPIKKIYNEPCLK